LFASELFLDKPIFAHLSEFPCLLWKHKSPWR